MKIIAIIHARMSSSRLPGKVLKDLNGKSVFYHHVERLRMNEKLDSIYLATSKNKNNKPLVEEARKYNIPCYAGAEEDVLERYSVIAEMENADAVLRCGCDKPLVSFEVTSKLINKYHDEDLLYVSTPLPRGIGTEIISSVALEKIRKYYRGPAITKYIAENPHLFKTRVVEVGDEFSRPEFRLTLDNEEDFKLIGILYKLFYKSGIPVDLREVFRHLDDHPELANINRFVKEKQINTYVRELDNKPVFSIYRKRNGKYVAKNRMGEVVPLSEFNKGLSNIIWDEQLDGF